MDLSIVIVNWNGREVTGNCLASIFANTKNISFEVILVDNGSTDGSVEFLQRKFSEVKLIANRDNTGYVHANNQGIAVAGGDFVLLLNNDTEVFDGTLEKMVEYMKAHPKVGLAGCQIVNPDGTNQYSVRHLPGLYDQIIILTKIHNFFPGLLKKHLQFDFDFGKEQEVEQVMGAFMMIRRQVIDEVGILDKNIWSWFEDVDYCQRVSQAGWKIMYTPVTKVMHIKSHSFAKKMALDKQKILIKSLLYYFHKHHGLLSYLVLWPFAKFSLFLAWLVQLFKIQKKNKDL